MERKALRDLREWNADRFTKHNLFKRDGSTAFILHFTPGQSLPPHRHPDCHVYLLVLEGKGTVKIDEQPIEVSEEEALVIEGDELFSFENTGSDPVRLYVVLSK